MSDVAKAISDSVGQFGGTAEDFSYIDDQFLSDVMNSPIERDWEDTVLPEGVVADEEVQLRGLTAVGPAGQTLHRAWVYKMVWFGDNCAFYWWNNGCSNTSGFRKFDSWQKTSTFCSNGPYVVWEVKWWA